jgi:hypothetical protein
MDPLMTVDVETAALFAAMDALGDAADAYVKPESKVTADNIVREARGRVARRTGVTATMIHAEETHDKKGYVVLAWDVNVERGLHDSGNNDQVNFGVPRWLEFGTQFMTAHPYLFASGRLEEGGHLRRVAGALQDAIDSKGLGD